MFTTGQHVLMIGSYQGQPRIINILKIRRTGQTVTAVQDTKVYTGRELTFTTDGLATDGSQAFIATPDSTDTRVQAAIAHAAAKAGAR